LSWSGKEKTVAHLGLKRLASELGIAERIHFPGYRSELLPVYAAFDLFVLSSRREGLPNSIVEAMALGLPVVTTDIAGAKELVVDGKTGFVVPQQDVERLGSAIFSILGENHRRLYMGRAGRQRVEGEFSFSRRLRRIEDLYEQVLHLPPSQRSEGEISTYTPPSSSSFLDKNLG
jgi:glycosyltransferase involved in cell wall biosynthesis